MNPYDRRSDLQKSIDRYVYVLQLARGDKSPTLRKALEEDVAYALEAMHPYRERFEAVFAYDLCAVDADCSVAVETLNRALEVLHRAGADNGLPLRVENPRIILAECAMTLVDTLRSLGAFDREAVEALLFDALEGFVTVPEVLDRGLKIFIHRFIHGKIPEAVVDRIAMDESELHDYLKLL